MWNEVYYEEVERDVISKRGMVGRGGLLFRFSGFVLISY